MRSCPPADALERLLAEGLGAAERDALEAHVEGCPACQGALARLAGGADPPGGWPPPQGEAMPPDRPDPAFLARVKQALARDGAGSGAAPSEAGGAWTQQDGGRAGPAADWPAVPGYEVLAELGRGGMGVVYLARDLGLKRLAALKMLPHRAHDVPDRLARFRAEAEAVARLRHPHIVQIFTWGEHHGRPYFVMEYVEGGSLDQAVGGRPQPPADAARLVLLLARAVDAAHQQGIVHRDLKPANVLLAPPADEPALNTAYGCPRVSDFGLARLPDSATQTASGTLAGTPPYMAPEQAAGRTKEVGPGTDVYALGAILYELLTGRPPFKGSSDLETLELVRTRPPRPVRDLRPDVPPALEAVCHRCLAKEPGRRYPTAAALADALRSHLSGGPAPADAGGPAPGRTAPPPATAARVWRRRRVAAGGLLLAASLVAAGALFFRPRGVSPEPVPAPLKGWIDVRVWKREQGKPSGPGQRLHQPGVLPLTAGDHLRIEAELNRPAYLYVVWLDSAGKATPIHPWRDQDWGKRPADEAPQPALAIPVGEGMAGPLGKSPSGVESILLLAREGPLPAGEDEKLVALFAGLPPQGALPDPRAAAWFENGELVRDQEGRGAIQIGRPAAVDDPVLRTRRLLRGGLRRLFPYTRAVCYGFQGG
jgi:hypothetical protein